MPPSAQIAQRVYYDEQHVCEFTAEVTEIRELARVAGRPVFQIALDRTAFYPTSGGQPHDTGLLVATSRSGTVLEAPVTEVSEDEAGEVWHTSVKPLQPGTLVRGRIDEGRRLDHMQQHSGQHLISAIAAKELSAGTVGFHLGLAVSTVDLDVPSLDAHNMERLEALANGAVSASLRIWQEAVSQEQGRPMLAAGVLRKLPDREGDLRIINIEGLDRNACGGTHVANTAAIGPVFLLRSQRVRSGIRLSFICGERALKAAREDRAILTSLALDLSTAKSEVLERVGKLQSEVKELRKRLRGQPGRTLP